MWDLHNLFDLVLKRSGVDHVIVGLELELCFLLPLSIFLSNRFKFPTELHRAEQYSFKTDLNMLSELLAFVQTALLIKTASSYLQRDSVVEGFRWWGKKRRKRNSYIYIYIY